MLCGSGRAGKENTETGCSRGMSRGWVYFVTNASRHFKSWIDMHFSRNMYEGYESSDSTDCDRQDNALFPPPIHQSSAPSTATSTPLPSRSTSPHPYPHQYYTPRPSSSCPSDTDDEPTSPLLPWNRTRNSWWRGHRDQWWRASRRRRRRGWRIVRLIKRSLRSIIRHPLFPSQPITIVRPSPFSLRSYAV